MSGHGSLTNLNSPLAPSARVSSTAAFGPGSRTNSILPPPPPLAVPGTPRGVHGMSVEALATDLEKAEPLSSSSSSEAGTRTRTTRTWYGRKRMVVVEKRAEGEPEERPVVLYAPVYNGLAFGLSIFFIGNGVNVLLIEWRLDGNFIRFALCAVIPLLFAVSLVRRVVCSVSYRV